jgi:alpha-N-arabinofuranosidase
VEVPAVSGTASVDGAGRVHVSLANLDPNRPRQVTLTVQGLGTGSVRGQLLTAPAMDSFNGFDTPAVVAPRDFTGARWSGDTLTVELPAKSVVTLALP